MLACWPQDFVAEGISCDGQTANNDDGHRHAIAMPTNIILSHNVREVVMPIHQHQQPLSAMANAAAQLSVGM